MASTTSTQYNVRIKRAELDELRSLAKTEGVDLSAAMRQGARMYLGATPEEREGLDSSNVIEKSLAEANANITKARAAMRSLGYDD